MIKVSTMRRLDRWVGLPLCWALTAARLVLGWLGRRGEPAGRRILFVKLAEQGSTVLAVPAIRRAIERVGAENVYFMVFEENRFILDVMELIPRENVIAIRAGGVGVAALDALGAVRRARRLDLDAAIDLEFFARASAALAFLSGARRRVGLHAFDGEGPARGDLMTHRLRFNPHLHTSQMFLAMVEALSAPPHALPTFNWQPDAADEPPPRFTPQPGEIEAARALLSAAAGTDRFEPLVLLNANCSDLFPLRRWPQERYVELARRLLSRYADMRVAFTGGAAEAAPAAALVAAVGSGRCFSIAGRTTLRQLLTIYGLARVLVTNDSGPAHFAALTPIQVVTLFGPETPRLFAARTANNHARWAGLACSPCISAFNNRASPCRDNVCMQGISVEEVFEVACRLHEAGAGPVTL